MNQRYEQLLAQAHIVPNPPGTYRRYDNILPEQMEKFAELIVGECGDVAYNAYWENPETVRGIHIKEKIKQHFGVEL